MAISSPIPLVDPVTIADFPASGRAVEMAIVSDMVRLLNNCRSAE
jgi:hypothetical protein